MPARPMRPCTHPGCRVLSQGGRCAKHPLWQDRGGRRAAGERRPYDRRAWRDRIRPMKLRANPLCEDCRARGLVVVATEVDHVNGDPTDNADQNLRSLCKPCHSTKTALHNGSFGRTTS